MTSEEALSKFKNKDIEEALVGSVILNGALIVESPVIQEISGQVFNDHLLGKIWDHIIGLWVDETPVDVLTLGRSLNNAKDFHEAGGVAYLTKLLNAAPSCFHAEAYAQAIRDDHRNRIMISTLQEAVGDILQGKQTYATDVVTNVEGFILDAASKFNGLEVRGFTLTIAAPELATLEFDSEAYIVDDTIYTGGVHLLAGDVASGKTWLAMEIAIAVASGGVCLAGKQSRGPLNVVYFSPDNRRRTMQARLVKTCLAREIEIPATLHFCEKALDLSSLGGQKTLAEIIGRHDADLIILDVLDDFYGAQSDENKATDVKPIIRALTQVSNRFDTASIVLHHTNKARGVKSWLSKIRGSVAIPGAVDGAWVVEYDDNKDLRTLKHTKNRDNPQNKAQQFTFVDLPSGGVVIDWEDYQGSAEGNVLASATASLMMEYLKSNEGKWITSSELKGMLKAKNAEPSKKTYEMAADVVARAQFFERSDYKRGKQYEYTYKPE